MIEQHQFARFFVWFLATGLTSADHVPSHDGPHIRTEVLGYRFFDGNCRGSALNDVVMPLDIKECASHCDGMEVCKGFSYGSYENSAQVGCILKSASCSEPIKGTFVFYEKGAARTNYTLLTSANNETGLFTDEMFPEEATFADCGLHLTNLGSSFAIMFMANRADQPKGYPLEVYVTTETKNRPVRFEITAPRSSTYLSQQLVVQADDVKKILVPNDFRMEHTGIESKVIIVRAIDPPDADLVVVGVNRETYTVDGFLGLPIQALGTEYVVVTWAPETQWANEFGIAAIKDNTKLKIELAGAIYDRADFHPWKKIQVEFNGRVYADGDTIEVTLNRYDSLLIINSEKQSDLTGTRITGSCPFALFSGNIRTALWYPGVPDPNRDHLVEQIPPIKNWGRRFVFTSTPARTVGDYLKIVAAHDGTSVTIQQASGKVAVQQLDRRQYATLLIPSNECVYIESTHPILVSSFSLSQESLNSVEKSDPSMVIIPPIEQYRDRYTFSTVEYAGLDVTAENDYKHYSMLSMRTSEINQLLLDGQRAPIYGVRRSANPDFSCAYVKIRKGVHVLENPAGSAFMGILYGAGDRESYAFPIGTNLYQEPCPPPPQETCHDVYTFQICHGDRAMISCTGSKQIKLVSAHFGRIGWNNEFSCKSPNTYDANASPVQCGFTDVYDTVKNLCEGEQSCSFLASRYLLLSSCADSQCQLCSQYLWVNYACLERDQFAGAHLSGHETSVYPTQYKASSAYISNMPMVGVNGDNSQSACAAGKSQSVMIMDGPNKCPGCSGVNLAGQMPATVPYNARFGSNNLEAWCPTFCDRNQSYIQIDLGGQYQVSGYVVQGRRALDQWTTKLGFSYSNDGNQWRELRNPDGSWIEHTANSDALGVQWCPLVGVRARYIRGHVLGYSGYPCLHLDISRYNELLGCPPKTIVGTNMKNEPGVRGASVTVKCREGWATEDLRTQYQLLCNADGQWEGREHSCASMQDCGDIPVVECALHNGRNTKYGSQVTYTSVRDDRVLTGKTTIFCQADGTWTPAPRCSYQV